MFLISGEVSHDISPSCTTHFCLFISHGSPKLQVARPFAIPDTTPKNLVFCVFYLNDFFTRRPANLIFSATSRSNKSFLSETRTDNFFLLFDLASITVLLSSELSSGQQASDTTFEYSILISR